MLGFSSVFPFCLMQLKKFSRDIFRLKIPWYQAWKTDMATIPEKMILRKSVKLTFHVLNNLLVTVIPGRVCCGISIIDFSLSL